MRLTFSTVREHAAPKERRNSERSGIRTRQSCGFFVPGFYAGRVTDTTPREGEEVRRLRSVSNLPASRRARVETSLLGISISRRRRQMSRSRAARMGDASLQENYLAENAPASIREVLSHLRADPAPANDPSLRLWAKVRNRQCDACGQLCRRSQPQIIGCYEPAGPATRLIYRLCTDCAARLPGDLRLVADLQQRLTCRCPEAMLAGLVTTIRDDFAVPARQSGRADITSLPRAEDM